MRLLLLRRLAAVAIALAAALSIVLTAPPLASACTGCPTTFREFVHGNDRIVLTRYLGRSGGRFAYHVIDVLKGRSPRTLWFKYDPAGTPPPPIGSRWLLSTFVGPDGLLGANNMFRVSPDGSVTPTEEGEGAVEAPDTLAGWYAAIARLPDSATVDTASDPVRSAGPISFLIAAAALGLMVMFRRLGPVESRNPRGPSNKRRPG
jgi:hypothetical protein